MKVKRATKKALATTLAMISAFSMSVPAYAATDVYVDEDVYKGDTPTSFSATSEILGGELIVSIPAEMILSYDSTSETLKNSDVVSAKGRTKSTNTLKVSVTDAIAGRDGVNIEYSLADDTTIKVAGDVAFESEGVSTWTASQLLASLTTLDSREISVEVAKDDISYIGNYSTNILYNIELQKEEGASVGDNSENSMFTYSYDDATQTATVTGFNWDFNTDSSTTALMDEFGTTDFTIPQTAPNGYKVTAIGNEAFSYRNDLTSIVISDGVSSIANRAFSYCPSLTSVIVPNSVTTIGMGAFSYCPYLTNVNIPDGVSSIKEYTFSGCNSLTNINIPNSVATIGENAFWDCRALLSIDIPANVTSIGNHAFQKCISLTNIDIPDSVKTIGERAFAGCTNLTDITFGKGLTSFQQNIFDLNVPATEVTYRGTISEWESIGGWTPDVFYITVIHCSDGDITL